MPDILFEDVHEALPFCPYISLNSTNFSYIPHYHKEIEIAHVISGSINIVKSGTEYRLFPDDILVIFPFEVHDFASNETNHLHIMKFYVPSDFRYRLDESLISSGSPQHAKIKEILDRIVGEYNGKLSGWEYAVNMYSSQLIAVLIREFDVKIISNHKEYVHKLNLLNQVNEYLEQHYFEKIYLEDAASYCGYSKYRFAHLFREITAISFIEYLTVFRLNKATALLAGDKKITNIAFECGFSNLRSFNRCFKKYFSVTPTEYMQHQD